MDRINENDFRGVDLNLLIAFLVLMRERSVSRAAEHLHLGQPAASAALARLRELFDDPLLIRGRRSMEPTPRALALEAELQPAMQAIHRAIFEQPEFDPASSDRTFVIGMPDWVEIWLGPLLFAALQQQAPSARLSIVNTDPFRVPEMLERGEMDLAVSSVSKAPPWCRQTTLCRMDFKCVIKPPRNSPSRKLSLREYVTRRHLLVSYRNAFEGAADEWLAARSLQRRVVLATTRFGILPSLLQQEETIATVPAALADRWHETDGLQVSDCPVPIGPIVVAAVWSASRDTDDALRWIRGLLASIATK